MQNEVYCLSQGEFVKKIIVLLMWAASIFGMADVQAGDYVNGFYLGGKIGVNASNSSGAVNAPNKATVAYLLQGGYLQGGYIFESKTLVLGAGAYFDVNPSDKHDNGVTYGSRAFGFDGKVGLPLGAWMPYAKLGYGYSTATQNLSWIAKNTLNVAFGMEYKIDPQWSLLGEYKIDGFSSIKGATAVKNRAVTFGFNYYFDAPPIVVIAAPVEIEEVEAPVPIVVPVPVTDAPPI